MELKAQSCWNSSLIELYLWHFTVSRSIFFENDRNFAHTSTPFWATMRSNKLIAVCAEASLTFLLKPAICQQSSSTCWNGLIKSDLRTVEVCNLAFWDQLHTLLWTKRMLGRSRRASITRNECLLTELQRPTWQWLIYATHKSSSGSCTALVYTCTDMQAIWKPERALVVLFSKDSQLQGFKQPCNIAN